MIQLETKTCVFCKKTGVIQITQKELDALQTGIHVQKAMSRRDAGVREQFISGTHPECWDRYLG